MKTKVYYAMGRRYEVNDVEDERMRRIRMRREAQTGEGIIKAALKIFKGRKVR